MKNYLKVESVIIIIIIIIIIIKVTRILIQGVMGTCRDFKRNKLIPLPVTRNAISSVAGLTDAFIAAMKQWAVAHRAFVILKGGDSP
jgi:hypothetical protein